MVDPSDTDAVLAETDVPVEHPVETLDARELPPPKPLQETLERLAQLDVETVLVQLNDRAPQHLYPRLSDRGYTYETIETDACTATVIWSED